MIIVINSLPELIKETIAEYGEKMKNSDLNLEERCTKTPPTQKSGGYICNKPELKCKYRLTGVTYDFGYYCRHGCDYNRFQNDIAEK